MAEQPFKAVTDFIAGILKLPEFVQGFIFGYLYKTLIEFKNSYAQYLLDGPIEIQNMERRHAEALVAWLVSPIFIVVINFLKVTVHRNLPRNFFPKKGTYSKFGKTIISSLVTVAVGGGLTVFAGYCVGLTTPITPQRVTYGDELIVGSKTTARTRMTKLFLTGAFGVYYSILIVDFPRFLAESVKAFTNYCRPFFPPIMVNISEAVVKGCDSVFGDD